MKFFYTIFCFLLAHNLFGQNAGPFKNPSFEGSIFPDWRACEYSESSPDLQPGIGGVTLAPFHGLTYMGMVTRGGFGKTSRESVSQELLYPLSQDSCYTFNIVINHSPNDAYSPYSRTAILRIWGSNNPSVDCGREELLWVLELQIKLGE
jgi:hypothetical protein